MAEAVQERTQVKGIGGWLLLPLAHLLLLIAAHLTLVLSEAADAYLSAADQPVLSAVEALLMAPAAYMLMALNYCLLRVLQHRREAPFLMMVLYLLFTAGLVGFWIAYVSGFDWALIQDIPGYPVSLIVAILINGAALIYFRRSERVKNTFIVQPGAEPEEEPEARGIGGALILPIAFLLLVDGIGVSVMAAGDLPAKTVYAIAQQHWWALVHNAVNLLFLSYSVFALVTVFRKEKRAPTLMLGYFGTMAVYALGSCLLPQPHLILGALLVGAISVAFAIYFLVSKRVKNTFVA